MRACRDVFVYGHACAHAYHEVPTLTQNHLDLLEQPKHVIAGLRIRWVESFLRAVQKLGHPVNARASSS